jgi:hypothetical protein
MQIGGKIYYDNATGNVLVDTGERSGDVVETTQALDLTVYKALAERVAETVGCLELDYEQYKQDFAACSGYKVSIETGRLEFSYPDPNIEPDEPQALVYQVPMSERIELVESDNAGLTLELAQTQARLNQAEQDHADLLLTLVTGGVL